jgi:hypothetical protein
MANGSKTQLTSRRQAADDLLTTEQPASSTTCCGGPAPQGTNACCVLDAEAKSIGAAGCGCGSTPAKSAKKTACCG